MINWFGGYIKDGKTIFVCLLIRSICHSKMPLIRVGSPKMPYNIGYEVFNI